MIKRNHMQIRCESETGDKEKSRIYSHALANKCFPDLMDLNVVYL